MLPISGDHVNRPRRLVPDRRPSGEVDESWRALAEPMRESIQLAWESFTAGNLGIGAVVTTTDGSILARGRNCLIHPTPGASDPLVNTSIAHAEMNALAQIPFTEVHGERLVLHTTLQPCLQCFGAVTLSAVDWVEVLAPDPLYRGLEQIREVVYFSRGRWPTLRQLPVTRWTVLALLLRTYIGITTTFGAEGWNTALPSLAAAAHALHDSGKMAELISKFPRIDAVAGELWAMLGEGLDDVCRVAASTSRTKTSPSS